MAEVLVAVVFPVDLSRREGTLTAAKLQIKNDKRRLGVESVSWTGRWKEVYSRNGIPNVSREVGNGQLIFLETERISLYSLQDSCRYSLIEEKRVFECLIYQLLNNPGSRESQTGSGILNLHEIPC